MLEMMFSDEVERNVGIDVEQRVRDDEQDSFQLLLHVAAIYLLVRLTSAWG